MLGVIRARGGRITTARVAIVQALLDGPDHVTVEELEGRVRSTAPDVHQATFYRTLSALEELGVVYHLHLGHGPSVWHLSGEEHEHLVCRQCGSVTHVEAALFDVLRAAIAAEHGFVLDTRHFVHQGVCRACIEARQPR